MHPSDGRANDGRTGSAQISLTRAIRFGPSAIEDTDGWVLLRVGRCELGLHRVAEAYRSSARSSTAQNGNVTIGEITSYPGYAGLICDGLDPEGNVFRSSQA